MISCSSTCPSGGLYEAGPLRNGLSRSQWKNSSSGNYRSVVNRRNGGERSRPASTSPPVGWMGVSCRVSLAQPPAEVRSDVKCVRGIGPSVSVSRLGLGSLWPEGGRLRLPWSLSGPGSGSLSGPGSGSLSWPGSGSLSGPGSWSLSGPGSGSLSGPGLRGKA